AFIGYVAGRFFLWAQSTKSMETRSILAYVIALALFVLGVLRLIGVDSIFGVFVAGVIFDYAIEGRERQHARIQKQEIIEAINYFFIVPLFIFFGIVVPWGGWVSLGGSIIAVTVAILLFRRVPMLLTVRKAIWNEKDIPKALFMGWFGPIGVSAIYYAALAWRHTGLEVVWVVVSMVIFASLFVHGLSSTPFTRIYGQYFHNGEKQDEDDNEDDDNPGVEGAYEAVPGRGLSDPQNDPDRRS
ncbi:MAG TPA: cation:proton antiporter, partial [Methanomicrobiales archaeon]|nr:cation:proton antiporter [Methanomicrobiales archaeon]